MSRRAPRLHVGMRLNADLVRQLDELVMQLRSEDDRVSRTEVVEIAVRELLRARGVTKHSVVRSAS